jgi:hypothetical protein
MDIYKQKEEEEEKLTRMTKIQIKAKQVIQSKKTWTPKKWAMTQHDQTENG